ncbi:MAG: dihydroorotase [Gammaproteobacteria bacterium]
MITIENVALLDGSRTNMELPSSQNITVDATKLTLLPGLIDPHVHFRTPGHEYKEDWKCAARAAIKGGYTTVFDMPNTFPPCVTKERLIEKKTLIDNQLKETGVPLRYQLYFGADKNHFEQIHRISNEVVGIKVFMGSSTGDLMMDDDSSLHAIFSLAHSHNLLVAVHAEDEEMIQERARQYKNETNHAVHSCIRTPEVAAKAVEKAIFLSEMYDTAVYILHVSCIEELNLIEAAKSRGVRVYAETTPHHLFLSIDDYERLHGRAQMNPPLRDKINHKALFEAIKKGVIDTMGSDHAPHTPQEKDQPYGKSPSGVPGIETTLPLLLTACHEGLLSLEDIVKLTSLNARNMFGLEEENDFVLVDLNEKYTLSEDSLQTKCGWSPFVGQTFTGKPKYTFLKEQLFDLEKL